MNVKQEFAEIFQQQIELTVLYNRIKGGQISFQNEFNELRDKIRIRYDLVVNQLNSYSPQLRKMHNEDKLPDGHFGVSADGSQLHLGDRFIYRNRYLS